MIDNRSWASETNYLFSCVDGFLLLLFSMAVHVCLKLVNCLVFGSMFVSAQWWVQCTERGQDGVERWRNFQWCWELTSSNLSESEAERHTRCKKEFALATALWLWEHAALEPPVSAPLYLWARYLLVLFLACPNITKPCAYGLLLGSSDDSEAQLPSLTHRKQEAAWPRGAGSRCTDCRRHPGSVPGSCGLLLGGERAQL